MIAKISSKKTLDEHYSEPFRRQVVFTEVRKQESHTGVQALKKYIQTKRLHKRIMITDVRRTPISKTLFNIFKTHVGHKDMEVLNEFGQTITTKYEKYFFGDFLSADFWQKL